MIASLLFCSTVCVLFQSPSIHVRSQNSREKYVHNVVRLRMGDNETKITEELGQPDCIFFGYYPDGSIRKEFLYGCDKNNTVPTIGQIITKNNQIDRVYGLPGNHHPRIAYGKNTNEEVVSECIRKLALLDRHAILPYSVSSNGRKMFEMVNSLGQLSKEEVYLIFREYDRVSTCNWDSRDPHRLALRIILRCLYQQSNDLLTPITISVPNKNMQLIDAKLQIKNEDGVIILGPPDFVVNESWLIDPFLKELDYCNEKCALKIKK